jgi:hypothetical protein
MTPSIRFMDFSPHGTQSDIIGRDLCRKLTEAVLQAVLTGASAKFLVFPQLDYDTCRLLAARNSKRDSAPNAIARLSA